MTNKYIKSILNNIHWGVINLIVTAILTFISRKIFLKIIGLDLLSVGVTITNLVGIFSITEFGVSNAVMFMCYEPLKLKDFKKLNLIIKIYRKANILIGGCIFFLGILFLPFLNYIITISINKYYLYIIYILILLSNTSTYYFSYNNIILSADQKEYKLTKVRTLFQIFRASFQIVILYFIKNYIFFLVSELIFNILTNIYIYILVNNSYPFLKENFNPSKVEEKEILKDFKIYIKGMAAVRIAGVVINNTDTILVSWLDTLTVGILSNYLMVVNLMNSIFSIFTKSIIPALGNYKNEAKATLDNSFEIFLVINNYFALLSSICFLNFSNYIINLWVGNEYILRNNLLFVLSLGIYHNFIKNTSWVFRDSLGYFIKCKNMLYLNAILNLIFSIILGLILGVEGIFLATIIANLLTNFWHDVRILYNEYLKKNISKYFIRQVKHFFIFITVSYFSFFKFMKVDNWYDFSIKSFIIFLLVTLLYLLIELRFIKIILKRNS